MCVAPGRCDAHHLSNKDAQDVQDKGGCPQILAVMTTPQVKITTTVKNTA